MANRKEPISKEEIAAVGLEVERRVVDPPKRRVSWEGKKVESSMKGLTLALENYLETMKNEIIKTIHENDLSVEVIARELARRGNDRKDDPECSSDVSP